MHRLITGALVAATLICSGAVLAQPTSPVPDDPAPTAAGMPPPVQGQKAQPAGFVAPTEPRANETNAERARSQPYNNAPFWRGVRETGGAPGVTNLPANEGGILIQQFVQYPGSQFTTAGEAWRQVRNQWLIPYGGALLLITLVAIALFYFAKGQIAVHGAPTGRVIERFTYFERAAHWVNAIAFCILAVSGIVMAFGKFFLLPLIGGHLFGWLTYAMKTLHNFVGPAFAVALAVVFFAFLRDNWPKAYDLKWLAKGGGFFTGAHVPSGRFNAGEKIVFWGGVFFLGIIVTVSGLVLNKLIPGMDYTRSTMQIALMVHAVSTLLMMAMFIAHIYLGTIGMEGAYRSMRDGYVDETWAREHHELWYEDIKAGRIPAQRSSATPPATPAGSTAV